MDISFLSFSQKENHPEFHFSLGGQNNMALNSLRYNTN